MSSNLREFPIYKRQLTALTAVLMLLAIPASAQQAPHKSIEHKHPPIQPLIYTNQPPPNYDVPNYTSSVIETKYTQIPNKSGVATFSSLIKTNDPPAKAFAWYQKELPAKGWVLDAPKASKPDPMRDKGKAFMTKAHKGDYSLFMFAAHMHKIQPYTVINVSVHKTESASK